MGFSIETGISAFTVFMQGLLSFFSPCVLPLVPLYLGYLSGGLNTAVRTGENSEKNKDRLKLFLRVLFFTVGIGSAFFILGLGASAAGSFFHEQRMLFARVGSERFSFDRSVYDRIYFAVFIGRHFYCTAFRSFQKAYEDRPLYSENRRSTHGADGTAYVYRENE